MSAQLLRAGVFWGECKEDRGEMLTKSHKIHSLIISLYFE